MANYEPFRLTQTGEQVQQDLNDMEALAPVTEESAGLMSVEDKQKLDGLPSGSELASSLSGKVDKVEGKGLSTNDYTDTDKQKVGNAYVKPQTGIPASDLNTLQLIGAPSSYGTKNEEWFAEHICSIADFIKMAQGEYLFAKGSSGNSSMGYDFIYHVAGATSHLLGIDAYSVEFYSGDNAIIVGYTPSQHIFTFYESRGVKPSDIAAWNAKYTKPSTGIPASDMEAGAIPDVSNFITKSVDDLVNYYLKSETYTKTEVQNLIAAINQFHYEIYASTSAVTDPASNVLYLIGPTGTGADKYEEYVYDSTKQDPWVKIGDTSIDLSGYVTTSALNTALADYTTTANLTTLLAGKQDTIADLATIRTGAGLGATAVQPEAGKGLFSGNYNDLSNKPTIPDAQIQSDWNQSDNTAKDYIKNKPSIPAAQVNSDWNANSGVAQILNKPSIPDAVEANPTVPSGTTPSDLTGLKIGSNYYGIPQPTVDNTPTKNSTNLVKSGGVYSEVHPATGSSQPAGGLLPNVFYALGTLTGSVTITFATPTDNTIENEYKFGFTADSTAPTITWPTGIIWAGNCLDDSTHLPEIDADTYYEVSVKDGKGIIAKFE